MTDRIYTFNFQIYSTNIKLNDQQVIEYEFIQLGNTTCTINNQLILKSGSVLSRWKESIAVNQKTGTQYTLKWDNPSDPDNKLLVITKVELIVKK